MFTLQLYKDNEYYFDTFWLDHITIKKFCLTE